MEYDPRQFVSVTEEWWKNEQGEVWVKRTATLANGIEVKLGFELTPYREIPFKQEWDKGRGRR